MVVPTLSFSYPGLNWEYPPLPLDVGLVYQFPVGTWVESLAIRRNGKILAAALSSPEVFQVDNRAKKPIKLVHTFADNATSCTGITRMGGDIFYVIVGKFNVSTISPVPGSWSVYKIDVRHYHPYHKKTKSPKVSLVASFPDATMLNGITILSRRHKWLLVSDSGAGVIYRLELKTGNVIKVLDDPLMKPNNSSGIGINGVKVKKGKRLYFTNRDQNILARMLIKHDGTSTTPATIAARVDSPGKFDFNSWGNVDVAQNRVDILARVTGDNRTTLAGGQNSTGIKLFGPTAVRFGEVKPFIRAERGDWMKAYVSTNGGTDQYLTGNITRGGTISVVDVTGYD